MASPFAISTLIDTRAVPAITRRAEAGPVSTEPNPCHIVFNRLETPVSTLFLSLKIISAARPEIARDLPLPTCRLNARSPGFRDRTLFLDRQDVAH
jgi:hypothetical protein